jgi:hypothetical protein
MSVVTGVYSENRVTLSAINENYLKEKQKLKQVF